MFISDEEFTTLQDSPIGLGNNSGYEASPSQGLIIAKPNKNV